MGAFFTELLAAEEHARLFEALEASADQIGLATSLVRVDVVPPVALYLSASMGRLFGRPLADLAAGSPLRYLATGDQERVQALIASRPVGAPPILIEVDVVRDDGLRVPVEVGVARVSSSLGELAVCHLRDITARRDALVALRRSEAQFRRLVDHAPDGVVILRAGRIVFANSTATALLGASEGGAIGQPVAAFLPPADAARAGERIQEMLRTGATFPPSEYGVLGHPERSVEIKSIPCDWEGAPAVLAFARDVSERVALQRRLAQADRLASLGTLAAAVAHEVNNPLTYATIGLARIEQGLAALAAPSELREHLKNVREGMDRVTAIVRDLTRYARDEHPELGPVDLDAVLDRALKMVDHELRQRARVVRQRAPIPAVDGHATRLEQIFVNLLINAAHAVRGTADDHVTIETAVDPDGGVRVIVSDNGVGMSAAVRERAFEPFFTTKPLGKGTGLGLSVSRTMVEAMGGRVHIDSEQDHGTRVTVTLRPVRSLRRTDPTTPSPASRRHRVLVVDDEPQIRQVVHLLLDDSHEIVNVGGGEEALAAIARSPFDAVLCDLMMPGMNGMELYRAIRDRHAGLERRIVFVTGGAFLPELRDFLDSIPNPRVHKPFESADLVAAMADLATPDASH